MGKILVSPKQGLNKAEEIPLPTIKCNFCGNLTTTGLHQTRLKIIKKGESRIINGRSMYKPPVVKQIDLYMCTTCLTKGAKWPGARP